LTGLTGIAPIAAPECGATMLCPSESAVNLQPPVAGLGIGARLDRIGFPFRVIVHPIAHLRTVAGTAVTGLLR
jgi:hypothetical protein